jgi:hypothetical protein
MSSGGGHNPELQLKLLERMLVSGLWLSQLLVPTPEKWEQSRGTSLAKPCPPLREAAARKGPASTANALEEAHIFCSSHTLQPYWKAHLQPPTVFASFRPSLALSQAHSITEGNQEKQSSPSKANAAHPAAIFPGSWGSGNHTSEDSDEGPSKTRRASKKTKPSKKHVSACNWLTGSEDLRTFTAWGLGNGSLGQSWFLLSTYS